MIGEIDRSSYVASGVEIPGRHLEMLGAVISDFELALGVLSTTRDGRMDQNRGTYFEIEWNATDQWRQRSLDRARKLDPAFVGADSARLGRYQPLECHVAVQILEIGIHLLKRAVVEVHVCLESEIGDRTLTGDDRLESADLFFANNVQICLTLSWSRLKGSVPIVDDVA